MPKVEPVKLSEFVPDSRNANKGTVRGSAMLERSLEQYGAGRSVLVDKHGNVIAGNKTLESAVGIGLDDALVVHTDGSKLVVVQRDDLDLKEDRRAMELGVADNRVGEINLSWAVDMLSAIEDQGAQLELFFTPKETEDLLRKAQSFTPDTAPAIASGAVTEADIAKSGAALDGQFGGEDTALVGTQCPECGHEFQVKPTNPSWAKA
jgi:hypothetical protein